MSDPEPPASSSRSRHDGPTVGPKVAGKAAVTKAPRGILRRMAKALRHRSENRAPVEAISIFAAEVAAATAPSDGAYPP